MNVQLTDTIELSIPGERLLIALSRAAGLMLEVERPRRLSTEIKAATRASRP